MAKKKTKIKNKDDWARFAIGYFRLSALVFQEILERKHDDSNTEFKIEEIYIPAIFNLKHGIEIFLKALSIEFLRKKHLDQSDYSHDIEDIFYSLEIDVGENRLQEAVAIYEEKHPDEKGELSGKSILDELRGMVREYYNLNFLKDKIDKDYTIIDVNNEALRYPTNNLSISIDYGKISKRFTRDDVLKSLVDCTKLETIFWQLYLLIYLEKTQ